MARCLIALGGNLGPVGETFHRALGRLSSDPGVAVTRMSRIYRSSPVGEIAGGEFQNAVAELETKLEPLRLLDLLQRVETDLGRTRDAHWGARTLDLDLILYADQVIDIPRLRVPHPACWYRRFVLDPMVEIAADVLHPERGVTFGALRSALLVRPFRVVFAGGSESERADLIDQLARDFPAVVFSNWKTEQDVSDLPALIVRLGDEIDLNHLPRHNCLDLTCLEEDSPVFLRYVLQSALDDLQPPAAEDAIDEPHSQ